MNEETYTKWNSYVFQLDGKSFKQTDVKLPNDGREFSRGTAAAHFGEVWGRVCIFRFISTKNNILKMLIDFETI